MATRFEWLGNGRCFGVSEKALLSSISLVGRCLVVGEGFCERVDDVDELVGVGAVVEDLLDVPTAVGAGTFGVASIGDGVPDGGESAAVVVVGADEELDGAVDGAQRDDVVVGHVVHPLVGSCSGGMALLVV